MFQYTSFIGEQVRPFISTVAKFRIEAFREFPYLYVGSFEYEKNYLEGFASDPRAVLNLVHDGSNLFAISTALPLKSEARILSDAATAFVKAGFDPARYIYFGEFIVLASYRKNGIAKKLIHLQEEQARVWNFTHACLSTVVRDFDDPRRSANSVNSDQVWEKAGYQKENIITPYEWPTIQVDGSVKNAVNEMVHWTKKLAKQGS